MVAHLKMDLFETEILCWKASFSGFMLIFLRCPWMCFLTISSSLSISYPSACCRVWNPLLNSLLPSLGKIMKGLLGVPHQMIFCWLIERMNAAFWLEKICVSNSLSCKFFDFPMSKHRNITVFKLPSLKKHLAGNHGKKLFALFLFRFPLFFFVVCLSLGIPTWPVQVH